MITRVKLTAIATVISAAFASTPASGFTSATAQVTVKMQVVKPLTLTAKANLDFGTVLMTNVVPGTTYAVTLSSTGALSCTSGLTCSASGTPATFNVAGSKQQLVHIYTIPSTFTNGTTTLQLTPSAQPTLALGNSGEPGSNFDVGASFSVDTKTTEGLYTGNLNVTVDYN
jgi:hypothetical protein